MDKLVALDLGLEYQYYFDDDEDWQVYWTVADDLDLLPKHESEPVVTH